MGLLDDAIREHLELKRLRGADPDEVARLEREALGPPHRRGEAAAQEPPPLAEDERGAPSARPDETVALYDDESDGEAPRSMSTMAQDTEEHDMQAELHAEPLPLHGLDEVPPLPDALGHGEPDRGEHGEGTGERAEQGEGGGERDGGEQGAGAGGGEREVADVLEETPDFLADVPEHDRMWFDQRPPRDFDFDK